MYKRQNIGNTSIDNIEAAKLLNLSVQPNPFKDFTIFSFDNPQQQAFSLIITDLQGRELRTYTNITSNSVRIDKKELAAGAYLYTLSNQEISVSGKIVVE